MSFIEVSFPFPWGLRELLDPLAFNIQVPSILDGTSRGKVYVDRLSRPSTAAVWDQLAAIYVAGEPGAPGFIPGMRNWCISEVFTETKNIGINTVAVYYYPENWKNILPESLNEFSLKQASRHYYTFQHIHVQPGGISQEFSLHLVDDEVLSNRNLSNRDWLLGWIASFWHTPDEFLKRGVGYCVIYQGKQIVSLCISVFMSGKFAELGTATLEQFQRRGLSTLVVSACIKQCIDRKLSPVWHCWADNIPSINVANKVGFQLSQQYTIFRMKLF